MMSLQEECDRIKQAIGNNDVPTIQQLLADNIDVINADIDWLGVSDVIHNVCHMMMDTVDDIIIGASLSQPHITVVYVSVHLFVRL